LKVKIFALFALFLLLLAGCKQNDVQKDLINYYNNGLAQIGTEEGEAISAYQGATGSNYKDDATLYDVMKNTVVPKYEAFKKKLEALQPKTDEVKELHKIYLDGVDKQYKGFLLVIEALEKQDANIIDQANNILNEGGQIIGNFNTQLDEMLKKHDVVIKDK
jgi:hypothetical protein